MLEYESAPAELSCASASKVHMRYCVVNLSHVTDHGERLGSCGVQCPSLWSDSHQGEAGEMVGLDHSRIVTSMSAFGIYKCSVV